MAVRAQIFRSGWSFNPEIGPNGKDYILGNETDFTIRLEKAGFRPVYLPNSLVYHQIRPEQLKTEWLYSRAFKDGRMLEKRNKLPYEQILFGVPKKFLRSLISLGIKRLLYFHRRETACQLGIAYWKIRGKIYQYREDLLNKGK
jgi:GT2 family glycosyltransferase